MNILIPSLNPKALSHEKKNLQTFGNLELNRFQLAFEHFRLTLITVTELNSGPIPCSETHGEKSLLKRHRRFEKLLTGTLMQI